MHASQTAKGIMDVNDEGSAKQAFIGTGAAISEICETLCHKVKNVTTSFSSPILLTFKPHSIRPSAVYNAYVVIEGE